MSWRTGCGFQAQSPNAFLQSEQSSKLLVRQAGTGTCILSLLIVCLTTAAALPPAFPADKAGFEKFALASYCRERADQRRQMECNRPVTARGASRCRLRTRELERLSAYIKTSLAVHSNADPLWMKEHAIAEASGKVDVATCQFEQRHFGLGSQGKLCSEGADIACLAHLAPACFRMAARCTKLEQGP